MISVVIPTLNAQASLTETLSALIPAAVDGLIGEVIVADGGSSDKTCQIADAAGAELIATSPNRGGQLRAGAERARHPWLLFLHADTILDAGWERDVTHFMQKIDHGHAKPAAAAFRFVLDDTGLAPCLLEALVSLRCALLRRPYGDQGLLIPRRLYDELGGYRALPVMEDLDLVRRLGARRVKMLRTRAVTSARRYQREGYLRRAFKNQLCLILYTLNVAPSRISQFYEEGSSER